MWNPTKPALPVTSTAPAASVRDAHDRWTLATSILAGTKVDTAAPGPPTPDAPPTSAIEEPASAEANPMARSRVGASDRATTTEASEGSSSQPRETVETVEGRVMTKKMLRELAARRGLSYTDMLAQARASGVDLPDE